MPPPALPSRPPGLPMVVVVLMVLTALPELVLLSADWRLVGSPIWRPLAYQYGAFWSGLLRDWQPNYAGQPLLMFVTYGFLHAGPGHLVGNMLVLAPLGGAVAARVGALRFLAVYAVAMLGGGLGFGLLSNGPAPMVGASGAIFGLTGALVAWDWRDRREPRRTLAAVLGLVALNVAMWALMGGQVAWETHLGGAAAGALAALGLQGSGRGASTGTGRRSRRP